jgi:hypothetical protein
MFSKVIRRTHMYLALFLAPWMLCYALSTILMNHAAGRPQVFVKEGEHTYSNVFEPGTSPREIARQILLDLELDGAFSVQGPSADGRVTINRQDLLSPRRITFSPAEQRLVIERVQFESVGFLYRFHRRRGFQQPYAVDRVMAISVDVVIVAMVFWALSGLWMWWELRATRMWGLACALFGAGLFTIFALTI